MTAYEKLIKYGRDSVDDALGIVEKEIAAQYALAYRYAKAELAKLYARYGDDITIGEAKKYNRYENMMASIAEEMRKATRKAETETTKVVTESVETGYLGNWFAMEQVAGDLKFGVLPVDAVRASVFSEYSGANFIQRYGILYKNSVDTVAQAITRGIATGTGYAKTAREVRSIFGLMQWQTERIIRTESHRAYEEGTYAAHNRAKDLGIKGQRVWLATFDGRTRPDHAALNGVPESKDGTWSAGGAKAELPGHFGVAGQDINCRCTTIYELTGYPGAPNWTYDKWEKEFGDWLKEPPVQRQA